MNDFILNFLKSKGKNFTSIQQVNFAVIGRKNSGITFHRFKNQEIYKNATYFDENCDVSELLNFDVVAYNRIACNNQNLNKLLKNNNIMLIVDIDDYWKLPLSHHLRPIYIKINDEIEKNIATADLVTTTSEYLKNKLEDFNKNIFILNNRIILPLDFKKTPQINGRVRFGVVPGSHHLDDIKIIRFPYDTDISFCGFQGNKESFEIEKHLTKNYTTVSRKYKEYLLRGYYNEKIEKKFVNENYHRYWVKSPEEYIYLYENIDVLLAPLKKNEFNKCKSNLKQLEAEATGTEIIATDIVPYKSVKNKIDNLFWFDTINRIKKNGL